MFKQPPKILFLCTGNSCRSQMAEGFARHLQGGVVEAYSAGTSPHGLNPFAVKVMKELGIDISRQSSKHVDELTDIPFDLVVTVCDDAHEHCPLWLKDGRVTHRSFDDPPRLAASATSEEEVLGYYRRVRDEIKTFVENLPDTLKGGSRD